MKQDNGSLQTDRADLRSSPHSKPPEKLVPSRLKRLLSTIQLLQSGRSMDAAGLSQRQGISRRTVFRDLRLLQEAGLHVVLDQSERGYRLPHFASLPRSEVCELEALSLLLIAQDRLGDPKNHPLKALVRSVVEKICQRLPLSVQKNLDEYTDSQDFSSSGAAMPATMSRVYECAWKGFTERRSLRVEMDSQEGGAPIRTLFDPFRIFFTRYGWYIVGLSHFHRETKVLDPSQVREVEIADHTFTIPLKFNLRRFIGTAWQLFESEGARLPVVVRFSSCVARRAAATKWDASQTVRFLEDGSLEFRSALTGTEEMVSWILSFGEFAEVVQPDSLRECVRVHARNMLEKYAAHPAGFGQAGV